MVKNLKGFAIFFNIEKFEKTFFDENFFLYFEEFDLCKSLKDKGEKVYSSKKLKKVKKLIIFQVRSNF